MVSQIQTTGTSLSDQTPKRKITKASLQGIKSNLEITKAQLPTYFNQAYQAILLVTIGIPIFFGLVMFLAAGAILGLRNEINSLRG